MGVARFRVYGRFDGVTEATVLIDRKTDVIGVRPLRRKRVYELPLAFVAGVIMERVIKAEAAEKVAAKKLRVRRKGSFR